MYCMSDKKERKERKLFKTFYSLDYNDYFLCNAYNYSTREATKRKFSKVIKLVITTK